MRLLPAEWRANSGELLSLFATLTMRTTLRSDKVRTDPPHDGPPGRERVHARIVLIAW
jgi:hypothetical protein